MFTQRATGVRTELVGAGLCSARQDALLFTEVCGEFVTSSRANRVVGPYKKFSPSPHSVGADESVRPQNAPVLLKLFGEFGASKWPE